MGLGGWGGLNAVVVGGGGGGGGYFYIAGYFYIEGYFLCTNGGMFHLNTETNFRSFHELLKIPDGNSWSTGEADVSMFHNRRMSNDIFMRFFCKSINNLFDYLWKEDDFMILDFRGQDWAI